MASMAERWGFLWPWFDALTNNAFYGSLESHEQVFSSDSPRLQIYFPQGDFVMGSDGHRVPLSTMVREALKLLAAVAYVEPAAWKFLLLKSGLNLGKEGNEFLEAEIPVRFVLRLAHQPQTNEDGSTVDNLMVLLYGLDQTVSVDYEKALEKIARMDSRLGGDKPGVDIEVPVQLWVDSADAKDVEGFWRAEKQIRDQWKGVEWSLDKAVPTGSLRCTFVVEPMIADWTDITPISAPLVQTMQAAMLENISFSEVSITAGFDQMRGHSLRIAFGQMVAAIFSSTRRAREVARRSYGSTLEFSDDEACSRQLGCVNLACDPSLEASAFEAIYAGIVSAQTTTKLSIRLDDYESDQVNSSLWWQWLAYGIFSNRAQRISSLETLALFRVRSMSVDNMEAFAAVLDSEHPEEDLLGSPHGSADEQDALLSAGAEIRFERNDRREFTADAVASLPTRTLVRVFSNDGTSQWADVLIPGFGWCQVQRDQLEFRPAILEPDSTTGLFSLTIQFDGNDDSDFGGLLYFLKTIGPKLKSLSLLNTPNTFDENGILEHCPKLEELALLSTSVSARFDFTKVRIHEIRSTVFGSDWSDFGALLAALSDSSNPLYRCLRRLRVYAIRHHGDEDLSDIEFNLKALLQMLEVNHSLEYLEVVTNAAFQDCIHTLRGHHLKPISRVLAPSTGVNIAFLSVQLAHGGLCEEKKKKSTTQPTSRSAVCDLDQHMLSNIFGFAATPVLRKVYFREYWDMDPTLEGEPRL